MGQEKAPVDSCGPGRLAGLGLDARESPGNAKDHDWVGGACRDVELVTEKRVTCQLSGWGYPLVAYEPFIQPFV